MTTEETIKIGGALAEAAMRLTTAAAVLTRIVEELVHAAPSTPDPCEEATEEAMAGGQWPHPPEPLPRPEVYIQPGAGPYSPKIPADFAERVADVEGWRKMVRKVQDTELLARRLKEREDQELRAVLERMEKEAVADPGESVAWTPLDPLYPALPGEPTVLMSYNRRTRRYRLDSIKFTEPE